DQPNQGGGAEYGNDDLIFNTHSGVPAAKRSLYHRSTGIRIYRPSNRVKTPLVMPGFVSRKTLVYSLAALTRRSTTGCRWSAVKGFVTTASTTPLNDAGSAARLESRITAGSFLPDARRSATTPPMTPSQSLLSGPPSRM